MKPICSDTMVLRNSGDFSFVQILTLLNISPMGNLHLVVPEHLAPCLNVEVRCNRTKKKKTQAALELLIKPQYGFFIITNVLRSFSPKSCTITHMRVNSEKVLHSMFFRHPRVYTGISRGETTALPGLL